jgi:prepilin-type N-terminal cleavage/methylation domain-containing protein
VNADPCRATRTAPGGFTLIEVIAALVIFSAGVLMVLDLTRSLSREMRYAATTSELVVRAQERLDSLESLSFDSLTVGTVGDTLTIEGVAYQRTVTISSVTGLLYQLDVTLSPVTAGDGPSYATTSYSAAHW